MDYGYIFSRSWHIVWQNKWMFVLGFLAAVGAGSGGGNLSLSPDTLPPDIAAEFERLMATIAPLLVAGICLGLIVAIIFWLIRLASQAGMIQSAHLLDSEIDTSFGEAFTAGISKIWQLIGVNVVLYGPMIVVGLIFASIVFATVGLSVFQDVQGTAGDFEALFASLGVVMICAALLFCLLVPLSIVVTFIYPFAQRGIVLRDMGVMESIRHGWDVIKNNIGEVILLAIFFVVIGFIFNFIVGLALLPFAFLSFGPTFFDLMINNSVDVQDILLLIGGGICLGLVGSVVNSIHIAFRSTAVTLAYKEFTGKAKAVMAETDVE